MRRAAGATSAAVSLADVTADDGDSRQTDSGDAVARLESAGMLYLARQPILDGHGVLAGWELLHRQRPTGPAAIDDADRATMEVTARAFLDFGLDRLVGEVPAFLNATASFLTTHGYRLLPADRVVLELLEDIEVDDAVLAGTEQAIAAGYRLAVDDYDGRSRSQDALLPLVSVVKLDLAAIAADDLGDVVHHVRRLSPAATLLAEKIESQEQFERCRRLGFGLYQGFLFARPEVVGRRRIPANALGLLQVAASLEQPGTGLREVAGAIALEPVLAYRLLRLVNSAGTMVPREVASVEEAMVYLGVDAVRQLALLLALSATESASSHLLEQSVIRARMCEDLMRVSPLSAPDPAGRTQAAFTAGLLSMVDVLLDMPMSAVLESLPVTDEIREALEGQPGAIGEILATVVAYEENRLGDVAGGGLSPADCFRAYGEAVDWLAGVRPSLTA